MNVVFSVVCALSLAFLLFTAPEMVLPALSDSSLKAVELSLKLCAVYALWMGVLEVAEDLGVGRWLAEKLRPVTTFLFGKVSDEAASHVGMNMSSNILGLGNAATPSAIRAIKMLDGGESVATYPMIMLVVLNATSLQLVPTSVISLRQTFGSASAADIILPSLLASTLSTALGVALVMLLYRREGAKKPFASALPRKTGVERKRGKA